MKKLLKTMLASLALAALVVSCGTAFQIGNINLDDPEVKAVSEFGAVELTWPKVDKADKYLIYRQEKIASEKKAKDDATLTEKVLLATKLKAEKSNDVSYVDYISVTNLFEEGHTYVYTVEAIAGDGSDARIAATADEADKQYTRGVGTVEVTIAEGMAPKFGTKVPAPEKVTFKDLTGNKEYNKSATYAKFIIDQDPVYEKQAAINTYGYACYAGTEKEILSDSLPDAGKYDIYAFNYWTGNNGYYLPSDPVKAEATITVEYDQSVEDTLGSLYAYFDATNVLSLSSLNIKADSAKLTWTIPEKYYKAGLSYEIFKADVKKSLTQSSYNKILGEFVSLKDLTVEVKYDATNKDYNYTAYDVIGEEKAAYYIIQFTLNGEVIEVESEDCYIENLVPVSCQNDITDTIITTLDTTTGAVTSADYYASGIFYFDEGATFTGDMFTYNEKTGWSEAKDITITSTPVAKVDIAGNYECTYYLSTTVKSLPKLKSEDNEKYRFVVYMKTKEGYTVSYYWEYNGYTDASTASATLYLDRLNATKTTSAVTLPIKVTPGTGTKFNQITAKVVLLKEVRSGSDVYVVKDIKEIKEFTPAAATDTSATYNYANDTLVQELATIKYAIEVQLFVDGKPCGSVGEYTFSIAGSI